MTSLAKIQAELKAPKGQYNSFGKYKYRSAEDILEAVKPICHKYGCTLVLTDDVVNIGDRYYVKATARLYMNDEISGTDTNYIEATAFAREDETKKGMDGSQITGTASSYARKYAMNGLFNIDDQKDADTDAFRNQNTAAASKASQEDKDKLIAEIKELAEMKEVDLDSLLKKAKVKSLEDCTVQRLENCKRLVAGM